jgi:hypothetical protein
MSKINWPSSDWPQSKADQQFTLDSGMNAAIRVQESESGEHKILVVLQHSDMSTHSEHVFEINEDDPDVSVTTALKLVETLSLAIKDIRD